MAHNIHTRDSEAIHPGVQSLAALYMPRLGKLVGKVSAGLEKPAPSIQPYWFDIRHVISLHNLNFNSNSNLLMCHILQANQKLALNSFFPKSYYG